MPSSIKETDLCQEALKLQWSSRTAGAISARSIYQHELAKLLVHILCIHTVRQQTHDLHKSIAHHNPLPPH